MFIYFREDFTTSSIPAHCAGLVSIFLVFIRQEFSEIGFISSCLVSKYHSIAINLIYSNYISNDIDHKSIFKAFKQFLDFFSYFIMLFPVILNSGN